MYVLFDLDLTLIESSPAEPLRRRREWTQVYRLIPQLEPYPGISELLSELRAHSVKLCIVTSAPSSYCSRVIHHWQWPIDATVCYHDTKAHKPDPAPIQEGLLRLGCSASQAISVGDSTSDIVASRRAGVYAVAALWGTLDRGSLLTSRAEAFCESVADLRGVLLSRLEAP